MTSLNALRCLALGAVLAGGVAACGDSGRPSQAPVATVPVSPPAPTQRAGRAAKPRSADARATARPSRRARASRRPSKAQFVARADRICARANTRLFALGPGLLAADRVARAQLPRAAAHVDKLLAIASQMQRRIAALGRPRSAGAARDALLSALTRYVADLRRAATAAHARDLRTFRSAFSKIAPRGLPTGPDARRLKRAMRRFAFTACGKPPII